MKSSLSLVNKKHTTSFRIVSLMITIALLWLMPAVANTSQDAPTSNNVSNSSTAVASSPADWTEFHRDNMQRWNPFETVLDVDNVRNLRVQWETPGVRTPSYLGQWPPAVANGVVYVSDADDSTVRALDATGGGQLWSFQLPSTGDFPRTSPAVANGVVYVGSWDGNIYALNASMGTKLWSFVTGGSVFSSPTVANGVVYVGSSDNNVYALNASSGAKLWNFTTGVGGVSSSPAVANGVVYIGGGDSNVYALNASTGAKLWSFSTLNAVASSPAVANGVVYVGSTDTVVYALNASTGTKLWSFATGDVVSSSPAVANGVVYVGSFDHNIYALSASTGTKLWSFSTLNAVASSPAVANGVVYIGSSDGDLYALNANTGAKLWSYPTGDVGDESSPVIVNGVAYVIGVDPHSGAAGTYAFALGSADLFLRITPSTTTIHQGDLLTYAFPVWNLGPDNAYFEVLNTQVPAGTTFDYIRISGTPGLGTCPHPPYQGTGQIVCHENASMAPNTTWTVRLTVKVTAPSGTVITENAATMADTPDPNTTNNTATVSLTVQ